MSIIYRSPRVGLNGKPFDMLKFRTLKEGFSSQFANDEGYTRFGKFLRKTKIDELPQLINVLKGDMSLVGPRPEEARTIDLLPSDIRKNILSVRPGMTDLASLYFINEEDILNKSGDPFDTYWSRIKPMKIVLQSFYVENKCLSLDMWILWQSIKKLLKVVTDK